MILKLPTVVVVLVIAASSTLINSRGFAEVYKVCGMDHNCYKEGKTKGICALKTFTSKDECIKWRSKQAWFAGKQYINVPGEI